MEANIIEKETEQAFNVIPVDVLLTHWQGHRQLTRKVIEAFPENDFYNFSIGGMRTFAGLTMEMLDLAAPGVKGILTGDWSNDNEFSQNGHTQAPGTKEEVLKLWDKATDTINELWPQISTEQFQKVDAAFGMYKNTNYGTLLYIIDNEIHHRGQGFVYLRALGIEPPFFWDR